MFGKPTKSSGQQVVAVPAITSAPQDVSIGWTASSQAQDPTTCLAAYQTSGTGVKSCRKRPAVTLSCDELKWAGAHPVTCRYHIIMPLSVRVLERQFRPGRGMATLCKQRVSRQLATDRPIAADKPDLWGLIRGGLAARLARSEERRVGKEG